MPNLPQRKQPPKPLTLPDGSPMYQAVGCLYGTLELRPGRAAIATPDGTKHKICEIRDQPLMLQLLTRPESWQGLELHWLVYPKGWAFNLVGFNAEPYPALEPGRFRIQGHCRSFDNGAIGALVRRNDSLIKEFSIINVKGFLPGLNDGELWRLDCTLDKGKLVLLDGQKLADAAQPRKPWSKGDRTPSNKPVAKVERGDEARGDRTPPKPRKLPAFERR